MALLYYYTARDVRGAFVRGSVEAASESVALASLRTRALFVTSIEDGTTVRGACAALLHVLPVSQKGFVTLFRSFATLVRAGVSIRRALDVAIEQCADARLREALAAIANDVENGLPLSDAMARHPQEFPRLFVAMIRAGEVGGILDETLERLAAALERDRATRKKITSALAYPVAVSLAAVALVAFLLVSIVPMFHTMYEQMHVPLPAVTSGLIAVAAVLRSPAAWPAACAALFGGAVLGVRARLNEDARVRLQSALLCVPVVGSIVRKASIARLARILGTLLHSGVALLTALEVAEEVVSTAPYRRNMSTLRRALAEGATITETFTNCGLYEPMFLQLVRVGEETGALDSVLVRLADYYDVEVEAALTSLGSLLEPAMIVLLGTAVGFIVSAIFIPLYTLIGNMK
jgi:type IV pilus assembly protein PilC